ncbi:MAG: 50S ribosomal protein L23 [Legionellales bacterium]|nr:50S ribosomal protein L23 [Legionellales bacterium]|tara:strand:+ start:1681 stop:1977 length:297 start_codon:yes stop_codon:yes gene_type:complete
MNQERIMNVLLAPHVSEKASIMSDAHRQYAFKVATDADKTEIKKAVEQLFKVTVTGVQVTNVKAKNKRYGKIAGKRKAWKKAYVTLAEGQDINFVVKD